MKPGDRIREITIIGAGNLGTNLAIALSEKGFEITGVYDIDQNAARSLANRIGSSSLKSVKNISLRSDLYIFSVSDNNLEALSGKIDLKDRLAIHTSGTVQMDILRNSTCNYGVIYPPQTFSKDHPVSFRGVPVCIEANSLKNRQLLANLVSSLTKNIYFVSEQQRRVIHLAAVVAGNFSNALYTVAGELLSGAGLDLEILRPIIRKTAANSKHEDIFQLQTGPAIREDFTVIKAHLKMLESQPEYHALYESISNMIIRKKHEREKL